jgi:hypothetical protein
MMSRVSRSVFNTIWKEVFAANLSENALFYGAQYVNLDILKRANLLSPITSFLAAREDVDAISETWLDLTSAVVRQDGRRTWGHVWFCSLLEYQIDETFRTRAGHCVTQSNNLYAVLYLRHLFSGTGLPVQFEFSAGKRIGTTDRFRASSHHVVMEVVPTPYYQSHLFDDGQLLPFSRFLDATLRDNVLIAVTFLASPEGWCSFFFPPVAQGTEKLFIMGTLQPDQVISLFSAYFHAQHLIDETDFLDGQSVHARDALNAHVTQGVFGARRLTWSATFRHVQAVPHETMLRAIADATYIPLDFNVKK